MSISAAIRPLIEKNIFPSEESAVRELVREYFLGQIASLQQQVSGFEHKYGLPFEHFADYLHERSQLLQQNDLSLEQRQALARAIMLEEDDWLDWKVAREMLDNWLGLRQELTV